MKNQPWIEKMQNVTTAVDFVLCILNGPISPWRTSDKFSTPLMEVWKTMHVAILSLRRFWPTLIVLYPTPGPITTAKDLTIDTQLDLFIHFIIFFVSPCFFKS